MIREKEEFKINVYGGIPSNMEIINYQCYQADFKEKFGDPYKNSEISVDSDVNSTDLKS